ncbi:MAG TPA: putative toxin-antitoxin system toxin component, PIN family [Terriglobales bacterium]
MRIVLDTTILVRATESSHGLARVLRYPRLQAFYGLTEERTYDFVRYLHDVAEIVSLTPLLAMPIRDVNDIVVMQTAVIGEANILCTRDEDFYDPVAKGFLSKVGITVMDDISLMHRLRS